VGRGFSAWRFNSSFWVPHPSFLRVRIFSSNNKAPQAMARFVLWVAAFYGERSESAGATLSR
jgi:hypothetical protein